MSDTWECHCIGNTRIQNMPHRTHCWNCGLPKPAPPEEEVKAIATMNNDELTAALVWADDRIRHTGTGHGYYQGYHEHLKALLVEQLRRAEAR